MGNSPPRGHSSVAPREGANPIPLGVFTMALGWKDLETAPRRTEVEIEEDLPLRVAPDWDEQARRANELARVLDRHLDYEAKTRLLLDPADFRPQHLCPEQRVQCLTDM